MSELALKLIAENKKNRNTYLDLGNCGLTELPPELGELVWLETLILSGRWYVWTGSRYQRNETENKGYGNHALVDIALLRKLLQLRTLV